MTAKTGAPAPYRPGGRSARGCRAAVRMRGALGPGPVAVLVREPGAQTFAIRVRRLSSTFMKLMYPS